MDEDNDATRKALYALLGELPGPVEVGAAPSLSHPPAARLLDVEERPLYALERLELDLDGEGAAPAYFVRPRSEGPYACMLYCHAHGGDYERGKDELLAGNSYIQQPPYAEELTARGMAALCVDARLFGGRRGRSESAEFKLRLWLGQTLWGLMVFDGLRSLEYLRSRSDVDAGRIGTMGISLGSTLAWWLAALDPRVKLCAELCCLTDYQALMESEGLDGHGLYYYVPSLPLHFTTARICSLIAPRPHLGLAGDLDPLTPPAGLDRIDRSLRDAYARLGKPENWTLKRYQTGHNETPEMRAEVLKFLEKEL